MSHEYQVSRDGAGVAAAAADAGAALEAAAGTAAAVALREVALAALRRAPAFVAAELAADGVVAVAMSERRCRAAGAALDRRADPNPLNTGAQHTHMTSTPTQTLSE